MRIKILIFPAALAVSIAVFIAYVWPQYQTLLNERTNLKTKEKILQETKQKKQNIERLTESLNQNKDKEGFVLAFLPVKRNDEDIINGLNYLATSAGVSLNSITVEKNKNQNVASVTSGQEATGSKDVLFATAPASENSAAAYTPKMQTVKIKASIFGNYENIKTFLEQVYKMEMYNNLVSYAISSSKQSQVEGKPASLSPVLTAVLEIDFGSLAKIQVGADLANPVFSAAGLNLEAYNKLSGLVSRNIPAIEVSGQGRANPFLP